jgi:rod shape-determining protein MreD
VTSVSSTLWDTLKIAPLVFVLALFQLSTAPGLMPYGSGPDLVLVVVVALALWRGSVTAAVTGFFGGLLLNAMVFVPLGTASLLYVLTAALVARASHPDDQGAPLGVPPHRPTSSFRLVPWVVAATLGVQIGNVILHRLLGADVPLAYLWWNQILPSVIQTALAACVLAPLLRWMFPEGSVRDAGIATA